MCGIAIDGCPFCDAPGLANENQIKKIIITREWRKFKIIFLFFFQFFSGFDSLRKSPPRAVQSFAWFSWGSIHFVFKNRWLKPLLHTQRNSRGIEEIISQLSLLLNSSQKKKGDRNKSLRVFDPVWSTTVCQMNTSPISPYTHTLNLILSIFSLMREILLPETLQRTGSY